jgi:thiamine pyrophosphate-dependent acetolactate synthase large subunit-like protein
MSSRVSAIRSVLEAHSNAFFILSNGLTSREASHFLPSERCFYMLHAMGEALSIGIGLAQARPDIEIVVMDGDYNALMGMSSWALMPQNNLTYYVLVNEVSETTGGQKLPPFPFIPPWCNIMKISTGKENTPNPPMPIDIWHKCFDWLHR